MTQNQAIVVLEPHTAGIQDVPYPTLPRDDYMVVRTTAVAINPTDWKHVEFEGEWSCEGCGIGFDYAGVVDYVGPAVAKAFKKGDRVAACAQGANYFRKTDGAFAKYVVVKGDLQIKVPEHLSDVEAATLGVSLFTTALSLYQCLELPLPTEPAQEPFTIFIYGGSTAMGVAGIQFAKLSGARVITTSSPGNRDYVQSFGAEHVLDYKSPTLAEEVLELAGGQLKYVYDCHADETSTTLCAKLANGDEARFVSLLVGREEMVRNINPNVKHYTPLGYSMWGEKFWFGKTHEAKPEDYELAKQFTAIGERLLAEGKLKPPRVFVNRGGSGLEGVLFGMEDMKNGNVSGGKLVYTM